MSFNLNTFKSKIDRFGGPALSSLFVVEFYGTDSDFVDGETLRFFCKTVTVPGVNLVTYDYSPRNVGMVEAMPTNVSTTQLNAVFIQDSQHRIQSFFHEWIRNVGNFNAVDGIVTGNPRNPNQLPYEFNYKEDYAVSMSIRHYSTNSTQTAYNTYDCEMRGVYPTEVSGSSLSWESNNEPVNLSVNFSFNQIKFFRRNETAYLDAPFNVPEPALNRDGLIDYSTMLGATTSSLQTLVDRETRIRPFSSILSSNRR